ncbi:MAG: hypothetical protein FJ290_26935 [Planctomycetes bacterium]|nr:hypothetical protein [Planctomycetota bacterium]
MPGYGSAAVLATRLVQDGRLNSPVQAWEQSVRRVFPTSESEQKKGCPRDAYLGLCEEGIVLGVRSGKHTRSVRNKRYALDAYYLILRNPELVNEERRLWDAVTGNCGKAYNQQVDVVLSLWREGLLLGPGAKRT